MTIFVAVLSHHKRGNLLHVFKIVAISLFFKKNLLEKNYKYRLFLLYFNPHTYTYITLIQTHTHTHTQTQSITTLLVQVFICRIANELRSIRTYVSSSAMERLTATKNTYAPVELAVKCVMVELIPCRDICIYLHLEHPGFVYVYIFDC